MVKEHVDGHMGLWQQWIDELKGTFNAGWLVCAGVATLGVMGLTHLPPTAIPKSLQVPDGYDKIEHVVAYGTMAALYLLALKKHGGQRTEDRGRRCRPSSVLRRPIGGWWGLAVLIVLGLVTLAAVDELTQPYVHRTCDFWDWTSDTLAVAGVCTVFMVGESVKKRGAPRAENVKT